MRSVIAVVLLVALAVPAAAMDAKDIRPFPVVATGDIQFDFDAARFCAEGGGYLAEYYFRIPNQFLHFVHADGDSASRLTAQLELELEMLDAGGNAFEKRLDHVTVASGSAEAAGGPGPFQLVTLSYPLNPNAWGVHACVRDLGARKRGLAYAISGRRRDGHGWARFPAEPAQGAGLCVSDIQFAWQIEASGDSADRAAGRLHIVPNPARTYGLKNPTLSFYYEVRGNERAGSPYMVDYTVERGGAEVYRSAPSTVTAAGGWAMSEHVDLSAFEPGTYVLTLRLASPGGGEAAVSKGSFNVLWTPLSWDRSEEEVLDEAELYLTESEFREVEDMAPGERARYLEDFWRRFDPTPGTVRNERLETFLQRVDYAKRQFSILNSGHMSDRGRIYVHFGEPDDIQRELIPVEADRLENTLQNDPFLDSELRAAMASDRSRPHAYEIWSYYGRGAPLLPGRDAFPGGEQIRFIFLDEQGFGDFHLKYSTDHGVVR